MPRIKREQLQPGKCLIFTNRFTSGVLRIKSVSEPYVYFEDNFNGEERTYNVENIHFTLANADYWEADLEPWNLSAGKPDGDATNWKVVKSYPSLCQLLADMPVYYHYPVVEVTYDAPDGRKIEFSADQLMVGV